MSIPIISDILNIIRSIISTAVAFIGHVIGSAPPIFKLIMFLFLVTFAGGIVMNYSIGIYYTCFDQNIYKPESIYASMQIKYAGWQDDENNINYCTGHLDDHHCTTFTNEDQCNCLCPELWYMSPNATCSSGFGGLFDWVIGSDCTNYNESCCALATGCYWISNLEETDYFQTLDELATKQSIDKGGLHLGCQENDDVSLYLGNMDLFAWETALALVLITGCLSLFSFAYKR